MRSGSNEWAPSMDASRGRCCGVSMTVVKLPAFVASLGASCCPAVISPMENRLLPRLSLRRERTDRPPIASVKALLPPSVVEGSPPPAGPSYTRSSVRCSVSSIKEKGAVLFHRLATKATDRLSAAFLFDSRFVVGRGARGVGRICVQFL